MKTIFDATIRQQILTRLDRLAPDTPARWGKFTATKMLMHVNDAMRMALDEITPKARPSFLRKPVVKFLIIYVLPFPKGAPTAPELLARGKAGEVDLSAERITFRELLGRVAAREGGAKWPEHPAFGPMTRGNWGVLGYKHTDHHWRQFGI